VLPALRDAPPIAGNKKSSPPGKFLVGGDNKNAQNPESADEYDYDNTGGEAKDEEESVVPAAHLLHDPTSSQALFTNKMVDTPAGVALGFMKPLRLPSLESRGARLGRSSNRIHPGGEVDSEFDDEEHYSRRPSSRERAEGRSKARRDTPEKDRERHRDRDRDRDRPRDRDRGGGGPIHFNKNDDGDGAGKLGHVKYASPEERARRRVAKRLARKQEATNYDRSIEQQAIEAQRAEEERLRVEARDRIDAERPRADRDRQSANDSQRQHYARRSTVSRRGPGEQSMHGPGEAGPVSRFKMEAESPLARHMLMTLDSRMPHVGLPFSDTEDEVDLGFRGAFRAGAGGNSVAGGGGGADSAAAAAAAAAAARRHRINKITTGPGAPRQDKAQPLQTLAAEGSVSSSVQAQQRQASKQEEAEEELELKIERGGHRFALWTT